MSVDQLESSTSSKHPASKHLTIGELAKSVGLSVDTLRYYEKESLLAPAARSAAGYRLYSQESIDQLQFIQQSKAVGFTLKETKELMGLKVSSQSTCKEVHDVAKARLTQIHEKISQLQQMEAALQVLIEGCPAGSHSLDYCTILSGLSGSVSKDL